MPDKSKRKHSPNALPPQPVPAPRGPVLLTIGIDRQTGQVSLTFNGQDDTDLALIRDGLTIAGNVVQARVIAAAEERGRLAAAAALAEGEAKAA